MKKLILIGLILLLSGCSVPAGEAGVDGSDGTVGANGGVGEDGRSYVTPVMRSYTWDTSNTVVCFSDLTNTKIELDQIAMNLVNNNNYLFISIPANSEGKKIQCIINDVVSPEVIVPDSGSYSLVFSTLSGTDITWGKYLNCERLNPLSSVNYFSWYLDGILQEYYYVDAFEGYML